MTLDELLQKYEIPYPYCGASAGDGWLPLVEKLIQDLIAAGWDKDCHGIKEKYGGLRFYIGCGNEKIWDLVEAAERMSFRTCENCGQPGYLRGGSWLRTLCDEHAKEAKREDVEPATR